MEGMVREHYLQAWGELGVAVSLSGGRLHELPTSFTVLEFEPRAGRELWTYATCGMAREADLNPLELHMFSRERNEELPNLLAATAHFHRTAANLGVGHSVNFGKPWSDNSGCEYGLVSLPYLDGPKLENMQFSPQVTVKFYWLIPISRAEVDFKKTHGLESLERKFEAESFDYADPHRESVC